MTAFKMPDMTVSELMDLLKECPPDAIIRVIGGFDNQWSKCFVEYVEDTNDVYIGDYAE